VAGLQFKGRRVLLLQGPVGPFFQLLGMQLKALGAQTVMKVNFNGGDWLFHPLRAINYRGTMQAWPERLAALVVEHQIDTILLFGDCRPIHLPARALAKRHGIDVLVFEEGYVRPNFVTLEPHGVNNHSRLPRHGSFYQDQPSFELPPEREVGNTFWYAAFWGVLYYLAAALLWPLFRHYRHHRSLSLFEALPWLRGGWRKLKYRFFERGMLERLAGPDAGNYFLVPLQVNTDAQVRYHSQFVSVPAFLESVIASFAHDAPAETLLVIKHHPLDRGHHDYAALIARLTDQYDLQGRLFYLHDQHLPTLLANARGVVTINSTVAMSALHHGTPVQVLGEALFDMPGLTFQGPMPAFWNAPDSQPPSLELYRQFRAYLVQHTQINGSFYRFTVFDWAALRDMPAAHAQLIAEVSAAGRESRSVGKIAVVGAAKRRADPGLNQDTSAGWLPTIPG
jgi:capsular polysaccharide export protein